MSNRKVKTIFDEDTPKQSVFLKLLPAALVILALTVLIMLTVFLVNLFSVRHLTTLKGGWLVDERNDITYKLLVPCPYMVNLDLSKEYAESEGVKYYKIIYMDNDGKEKHYDPKVMIAGVDEYRNVDLYVAQDFTFPEFDELNPILTKAYYSQIQDYEFGTYGEETTKKLVSLIKDKENAIFPPDVNEDSFLNLYLIDSNYPYFWYTLEYFETESGERYLHDIATGKYVKATSELEEIFGGSVA